MGYVQKRNGNYRARYKDPVGHVHSKTFDRKMDAERFLVSIEAEKLKGTGSTLASPTCPSPDGLRSSWRCAAGSLPRRRRPTSVTSRGARSARGRRWGTAR